MATQTKFSLSENDIPKAWYNIQADLPEPLPPVIHPGTMQPIGPDDLAPLFPMGLIAQEVSQERYIEIPEPVREIYRLWRPTPLFRAHRLEQVLDTPAHIYYKYEGVSPAGSHKLNTSTAQAFYSKEEGVSALTTETGAGQWGSALAMACDMFGLGCEVYMVKVSYHQKPYRRVLMQMFGATVTPSPSTETEAGRAILKNHPDTTGSLGMAISEAVEVAVGSGGKKKYSLGSVLNLCCCTRPSSGWKVSSSSRRPVNIPMSSSAASVEGPILPDFSFPSSARFWWKAGRPGLSPLSLRLRRA